MSRNYPSKTATRRQFEQMWLDWWDMAGGEIKPGKALAEILIEAYSHPSRAYHNLRHINQMLDELATFKDAADHPAAIALAIGGHDVIYNPALKDNEERSAVFITGALKSLGISAEIIHRVHALVMATKHHAPSNQDEMIIVDADLAILGQGPYAYSSYSKAIRQEYRMYDDEQYIHGRTKFLESLLDKPHIFHLPHNRVHLEGPARRNIKRELAKIRQT
jgi:predicted metal-dependent HD superfamily phosphohydrolase